MMITAKIEPGCMSIKELVDHLENLEMQDEAGTVPIPKKKKEYKPSASNPPKVVISHIRRKNEPVTSVNYFKVQTSLLGRPIPQHSASPKTTTKNFYKKVVIKDPIGALIV